MTTTSRFTATALAALLTIAPVAAFAQATGPSTTGGTTTAPATGAPATPGTTASPAPATMAAPSTGHAQRASQATLESAQQELQQQGYYSKNAKVDGKWGPRTRHAVRNYQQAKGLPVTGKLDQPTLSALGVHGS